MPTKQVCVSLTPDLLEKVEGYAAARNLTRSAAIGDLVARGLASLDREAGESAIERRLDEIAAVAYANHALVEWYLPQAFKPADRRPRPKMLRNLSLAASTDYFLAIGDAMSRNRGNIAFALADTGGNGNDSKIDVKANDFADRADFCAFYRAAGTQIESDRAQRERAKEK